MRYSSHIKPISYLKDNAAEVLTQHAEQRQPMVITQNGEAKAVLQDVASDEETQETLALLKILALGNQEVVGGNVKPVADVVAFLRAKCAAVCLNFRSAEAFRRNWQTLGLKNTVRPSLHPTVWSIVSQAVRSLFT